MHIYTMIQDNEDIGKKIRTQSYFWDKTKLFFHHIKSTAWSKSASIFCKEWFFDGSLKSIWPNRDLISGLPWYFQSWFVCLAMTLYQSFDSRPRSKTTYPGYHGQPGKSLILNPASKRNVKVVFFLQYICFVMRIWSELLWPFLA